jgi:AraC-like DNA-binding protein
MKQNQAEYPKFYLYRRIVLAKLFIDDNYWDNIDLDNISSEASFSKFHFVRQFNKTYGYTPHQYLTKVRIERAKDMLATGLTVTETCFAVGFSSPSTFTGLFKKAAGCSPSQYRTLQLMRRDEITAKPLNYIPGCFAEARGFKKTAILKK